MHTLRVSEAEAVQDFAALLKHVQAGGQVLIEQDGECIAVLGVPDSTAPGMDPEYDAIVIAKIEEALNDQRPPLDSETVEAYFAKRRQASGLKELRMAG